MQNKRGKYAALNISSIPRLEKTMKKLYTVTVCLCDVRLFSIESALILCTRKVRLTIDKFSSNSVKEFIPKRNKELSLCPANTLFLPYRTRQRVSFGAFVHSHK